MASRKTIMQALYNRLSAGYPFKAGGRRLVDPENVKSDKRPALYVVKHDETFVRPSYNLPPVVDILAWAIVYTDVPRDAAGAADPSVIPEDEEDDILDALEAALTPGPADDGRQTLGGLVHSCIIDGVVERAAGDVTGKGMLAIPIKIMRP